MFSCFEHLVDSASSLDLGRAGGLSLALSICAVVHADGVCGTWLLLFSLVLRDLLRMFRGVCGWGLWVAADTVFSFL